LVEAQGGLVLTVKKTYQQEPEVLVLELTLNWAPKQALEAVLIALIMEQISQQELEALFLVLSKVAVKLKVNFMRPTLHLPDSELGT
jgi:hypothetical protein